MNKAARKAVNLSVLQRHDPHISDIIDSSSHVVVYKFDEDSQTWTKKNVEGTMFVFKRSTAPSYGFFIMNRLGLENLMADLTGDMALQLTSDYIIYRAGEDIHGIWIFETTDRDRIAAKLQECCKKAMEESQDLIKPSTPSDAATKHQSSPQRSSHSPSNPTFTDSAATDPLTRMLSEAMSRARVSETSGAPLVSQFPQQASSANTSAVISSPVVQKTVQPPPANQSQVNGSPSKSDIPSFLLAIISKEEEQPAGSVEESPSLRQQGLKDTESTQSKLLSSLTGSGKTSPSLDRQSSRQNGPPLSAEFLPPSVMPSGLYSNNSRPNGAQGSQAIMQHQSPSMAAAMLNRSNGVPAHASPLQTPAFAYSPGMMPSPLAMPPMQGGPMMRPTPPPPLPFQHHPMGPSMGMPPPPPPPQPPMLGASFPADAMHAAMGAVGFMQQQQRGFVGHGSEVLSKAEFSQQFMGLVQNDPQFMDVLYSNYAAVIARRG
ncbi:hypothetical protein BGX26_004626 [Mortierella sp. AD094]|nr:hypothetical protein BGX26_004626 [Mortierella sp. AD094]